MLELCRVGQPLCWRIASFRSLADSVILSAGVNSGMSNTWCLHLAVSVDLLSFFALRLATRALRLAFRPLPLTPVVTSLSYNNSWKRFVAGWILGFMPRASRLTPCALHLAPRPSLRLQFRIFAFMWQFLKASCCLLNFGLYASRLAPCAQHLARSCLVPRAFYLLHFAFVHCLNFAPRIFAHCIAFLLLYFGFWIYFGFCLYFPFAGHPCNCIRVRTDFRESHSLTLVAVAYWVLAALADLADLAVLAVALDACGSHFSWPVLAHPDTLASTSVSLKTFSFCKFSILILWLSFSLLAFLSEFSVFSSLGPFNALSFLLYSRLEVAACSSLDHSLTL